MNTPYPRRLLLDSERVGAELGTTLIASCAPWQALSDWQFCGFSSWNYSQWVGREELFERERASDPDWYHWNACALVADQVAELV